MKRSIDSVRHHMTIEQQCIAARKAIAEFVNRSAAQHLYHYRKTWSIKNDRSKTVA